MTNRESIIDSAPAEFPTERVIPPPREAILIPVFIISQ